MDLMKAQSECLSWKNSMYKLTKEKHQVELAHESLPDAHTALLADHEMMKKKLQDVDVDLVKAMTIIKELQEQLETTEAEYIEQENAATIIVDSVDPVAPEMPSRRLLDRLCNVSSKFTAYVHKTCCFIATRVLAVVKSFYVDAELDDVPDGRVEDYAKEDFEKHLVDMKLVVEKVTVGLDLS
ncbi:unnamed protein product [Urochloa humidicola]